MDRQRLSPEFFQLIHHWDPNAVDDQYYVTSREFTKLHSHIREYLIRRLLWWTASVTVGTVCLAIYFG